MMDTLEKERTMLKCEEAVLVFIDVQGKLHEIMCGKETLDGHLEKMVRCAHLLEVPIVGTEQIPEKLGPTSEPFKTLLEHDPMIAKSAFSCCGDPKFMEAFQSLGKRQAILIGIYGFNRCRHRGIRSGGCGFIAITGKQSPGLAGDSRCRGAYSSNRNRPVWAPSRCRRSALQAAA
jgi:hypothetical protein